MKEKKFMNTLGDGNCAFNAFALGIYHFFKEKSEKFYFPDEFLREAKQNGETAEETNNRISQWLNTCDNLEEIQRQLAPILRRMSINYLRTHYQHSSLDASFEDAACQYQKHGTMSDNTDNTFKVILFIENEFKKMQENFITLNMLINWWKNNGRNQYFDVIAQNAENALDRKRWGSQVELDVLAQLFRVGLKFSCNGNEYSLGVPHGFINPNSNDLPDNLDLTLLQDRNIAALYFELYVFHKEFNEVVDPVPYYETLIAQLKQYQGKKLTIDEWVTDIPENDRDKTKLSLKKHYAVNDGCALSDRNEHHNMLREEDIEKIKKRISSLPDNVVEYLKKKYVFQQSQMLLTLSGDHWSFQEDKKETQQQSLKSLLSPGESYAASGVKRALHGTIYQLVLLMLFLKRGFNSGLSFELATEMDDAEKFDDVVMICKEEKRLVYHYLQAKHKQSEDLLLSPSSLLDENEGDFSLLKYFMSFRKIQKRKSDYDEKIFKNIGARLKSDIGNIILYTNASLDVSEKAKSILNFKKILATASTRNFLIDIGKQSGKFQYQFDIFNSKDKLKVIYDKLKKASRLHQVAELLALTIHEDKDFNLKDEHFKIFHVALAKEVFDVSNKKFKETFITGNSKNPITIKLFNLFKQKLQSKRHYENDFNKYWETLENKTSLKFSNGFGKQRIQLDENPKLRDAEKTAQAFINLIKNEIITIKNKGVPGFKDKQLEKLVGHVIVKKTDNELVSKKEYSNYYFSASFISGDGLHKELNAFRGFFINELSKKNNKFKIEDLTIKIKEFETCVDGQLEFDKLPEQFEEDEITDDQIDTFFKHLILAVKQPKETELYDIIEHELGGDLNLINSELIASFFEKELLNWFKEQKGRFLNEQDANSLFTKAKELLAHYVLLGTTLAYSKQIEYSKIKFKNQMDINAMLESNCPVQCIVSQNSTWLSAIKLYWSLKLKPAYEKEDAFIILKINTAIYLENKLIDAFSKSNLLIIEIDEIIHQEHLINLLTSIKKIIDSDIKRKKKLWFIVVKQSYLELLSQYVKYEKIDDSKKDFDDFDEETKNGFLNKEIQISYFGRSDTFKQKIRNFCPSATLDISLELLELLINNDIHKGTLEYQIPLELMNSFDRECYIERSFEQFKEIKNEIITSNAFKDILVVITNENSDTLIDLNKFLSKIKDKTLEKDKQDLQLEKHVFYCNKDEYMLADIKILIDFFDNSNIHILEKYNNDIFWVETYGKLDQIKSNIVVNTNKIKPLDELEFNNIQYTVIAAEPGMGKSTVIDHLIEVELGKNDFTQLLLKIDLKKYANKLKNGMFFSVEDVVIFLKEIFSFPPIFIYYFKFLLDNKTPNDSTKIHFYLDGFDEIDTTQQENLCQLLAQLRKTKSSITIATRKHKTLQLENSLLTISHQLVKIEKIQQATYLQKYWEKYQNINKQKLKEFVEYILDKFSQAMNDPDNTFMGIPLQLRLIADAFEEDCITYCNSNNEAPNITAEFNKVWLYESIINKKFKIYFQDKLLVDSHLSSGLKDSLRTDLLEAHQVLAFKAIFPNILLTEEFFRIKYFSSNDLNLLGLIEIREYESKFIHRTFSEYLIALKLFNLLKKTDVENLFNKAKELILTTVFLDCSEVILRFMVDLIETCKNFDTKNQWKDINQQVSQYFQESESYIALKATKNTEENASKDETINTDNLNISKSENISKELKKLLDKSPKNCSYNDYNSTKEWINNLMNFSLKNDLSLVQINFVLDEVYTVTERYKNVIIIKEETFDQLPKLSLKYMVKAFFPRQDLVNFSLEKLKMFSNIYITKNEVTLKSGTTLDITLAEKSQERFKDQLKDLEQLKELLSKNECQIDNCFNDLDKARLMYLFISFREKSYYLSPEQSDSLRKQYDTFKENQFYYGLMLQLPNKKEPVNSHREWLCEKKDLNQLKQLRAKFTGIDYELDSNLTAFRSIDPANLFYIRYSNNSLTEEQLEWYIDQADEPSLEKEEDRENYESLFLKVSHKQLERVKKFSIEKNKTKLLSRLKSAFPVFFLSSEDWRNLLEKNDFLWLEDEGAQLVVKFGVFNKVILDCFGKKINESRINGFHIVYADRVVHNLIKPFLSSQLIKEIHRLAFLQCIYDFTTFCSAHSRKSEFDYALFINLIRLHILCFDDYAFDKTTLTYVAHSLLFFVNATINTKGKDNDVKNKGCFLVKKADGLMIIDRASDFNQTFSIKYPIKVFNAIESALNKTKFVPKLDECYSWQFYLATVLLRKQLLLKKRKEFVCSHETVLKVMSDETIKKFMKAVASGSLHDAMQIARNKPPKSIIFAEGKYKFFDKKEDHNIDEKKICSTY